MSYFSLKRRLSHLVGEIIKFYYSYRYGNISIGCNVLFCHGTRIIIKSNAGKVIIGDNCMLYGKIVCDDGGKVVVGNNISIRMGSEIQSALRVIIDDNVIVSNNVYISDNNNHSVHPHDRLAMVKSGWASPLWGWRYSDQKEVRIFSNVWIGQHVRICKGVSIAKNSVVAANSVVVKDVPEDAVVAGNPAMVVKVDLSEKDRKIVD